MTIRHQIETETLFFVIMAAFAGSFLVWHNNQTAKQQYRVTSPIVASYDFQAPVTSPTAPAPANTILQIETGSQVSPDGEKTLNMKVIHNNSVSRTYSFFVYEKGVTQEVFTTTLSGTDTLSIPFNAWSPDNQYFFIQKNTNDALVFKATGEPIAQGQQYFDVVDAFTVQNIPNRVAQTTGWASPTLLIVNSTAPDGTKGPSYWFEVPSKAIIPLSTEF